MASNPQRPDRSSTSPETSETTPDCERCCGLCCAALPLVAGVEFAFDKAPGVPCPHLCEDFRCGIHDRLEAEGFRGCVAYDCHGAGQKVTQVTFGGRDWRRHPEIAASMFATFKVMEGIHEQLMLLDGALELVQAVDLHPALERKRGQLERLSRGSPDQLGAVDVAAERSEVQAMLRQVGERMRAAGIGPDALRR